MFLLLEILGTLTGIGLGIVFGKFWFGWFGLIGGAVVGYFLGRAAGRMPYAISLHLLKRNLIKCETTELKVRLAREYYISHYLIAELLKRGEPIESFRQYNFDLLNSESEHQRKFAETNLQIWPELSFPTSSISATKE